MGDGISDRAARSAAGQALLSIDFAKGLALIQEAESDRRLPEVLLGAAEQALVGGDRALALRCVDEALAASDPDGNGSRPLLRCSLRARAGRILLALGDARAEGLLRHAETDARRLTDAGVRGAEPARWVGEVAACLCALDPGAAVGILVSERTPTEAVVSVAQQIAPTDPDRALVLAREHDQRVATRGRGGPSAADSPALPDVLAFLPAARFHQALQLARGIGSPRTRARIFCQLAAVGPPDRVGALLAEAAEAAAPAPGQSYRAEEVLDLARIALVAARVGSPDYKRLALRAVAAYPRPLAAYPDHPFGIADDGRLAQMLALGSPELSRAILEWALRCTGGVGGVDGESYDELASAAVAIDVQWGLDLLGQMPPDTDIGPYARLHRAPAALAIAAQLVTPPEDHETALLREQGRESWVPVDPCLGELARCRAPGP